MRLLTFAMLLLWIGLFACILRQYELPHPKTLFLTLMSAPPIYVCGGLWPTELPACIFFYGYLLLAVLAIQRPDSARCYRYAAAWRLACYWESPCADGKCYCRLWRRFPCFSRDPELSTPCY